MFDFFRGRVLFLLPPLVLGTWGIVLLQVWWSGRLGVLLAPVFRPWVAVGGLLLVLLACSVVALFEPASGRTVESIRAWRAMAAWIFLLAAAIVPPLFAPNSYSEKVILARGLSTPLPPATTGANAELLRRLKLILEEGDPVDLTPYDLLTVAALPEAVEMIRGHKIRVTGQYAPMDGGPYKVVQLLVFCCAADALPLGIQALGGPAPPAGLRSMDWMAVTGEVTFDDAMGVVEVKIAPEKVEAVPPPNDLFDR
jgi:uncharacterized repeat protein (TIGR03943 family)